MRHRRATATIALSAALLLAAHATTPAGDLDPPPGPVAPTMKSLDTAEPRIPIGPETTPGDDDSIFRITSPGSYYLTGNVNAQPGKSGIEIAAHAVSIDLAGFALVGVADALHAVAATGQVFGVGIRNGTIWFWPGDAIAGGTQTPGLVQNGRVENITAMGNGGAGIALGDNAVILGCSASDNGAEGFLVNKGAVISNCASRANAAAGFLADTGAALSNCHAGLNQGPGFSAAAGCAFRGCTATNNSAEGFLAQQGTIADCRADDNALDGIRITASDGASTIRASAAHSNGADGIDCNAQARIIDCTAAANAQNGIRAGAACTARGCVAAANGADGIRVASACIVIDSNCQGNGPGAADGAGIHATGEGNRIEGNTVNANDRGIDVDAPDNVVLRNFAHENTVEFDVAAGSLLGTITTTNGSMNSLPNAAFNMDL